MKEICPASYIAGLDGEKIHYATKQELQSNGGVCKDCHSKFHKRHAKSVNGNTSAENLEAGKEVIKNIHRHFDEDGMFADTQVDGSFAEFNYETIDQSEQENSAINFASKAIYKFSLRLLERGQTPQRIWTSLNAICFAAHIHPSQAETMDWFAKKLKMSKANFSLEVNHWRDLLNLPVTSGGKKKREASKESAKASHKKRGHIMDNITFTDALFQAINRATEHLNKQKDKIRQMTPERRQELIDRLKPLSALQKQLEQRIENRT